MSGWPKSIPSRAVAWRAFERYAELHTFTQYPGILAMHGLARLALVADDGALLDRCREALAPFIAGEADFHCNFMNYKCGGNGAAFLHWQGKLPQARDILRRYADELLHDAPRDDQGVYCMPSDPNRRKIWIDVAFAVTPFLLFCGLAFDDEACVEEAWRQTHMMYEIFRNPDNGLLHQARGIVAPMKMSEDHWSRGNGWGIHALAELAAYLPEDDARGRQSRDMLRGHLAACLAAQDDNGMWHQDMTDHQSYVETSGTGLILYALGVAIEKGIVDEAHRTAFEKGLRGYMGYVGLDGSVHHCCRGCMHPGDGSAQAYKEREHIFNDPHAFGPVVLAFGQAHALGIADLGLSG